MSQVAVPRLVLACRFRTYAPLPLAGPTPEFTSLTGSLSDLLGAYPTLATRARSLHSVDHVCACLPIRNMDIQPSHHSNPRVIELLGPQLDREDNLRSQTVVSTHYLLSPSR